MAFSTIFDPTRFKLNRTFCKHDFNVFDVFSDLKTRFNVQRCVFDLENAHFNVPHAFSDRKTHILMFLYAFSDLKTHIGHDQHRAFSSTKTRL